MILEAFSETLRQQYKAGKSPEPILRDWLLGHLQLLPRTIEMAGELSGFESWLEEPLSAALPLEYCRDTEDEEFFTAPAADDHAIASVIRREITAIHDDETNRWMFIPNSHTGKTLLKSLLDYCQSYDHWQFSRWLHRVQASDFHLPSV